MNDFLKGAFLVDTFKRRSCKRHGMVEIDKDVRVIIRMMMLCGYSVRS